MAATVEQLTNPDALESGMAVVSASRFAMGPGSGVLTGSPRQRDCGCTVRA